MVVELDHSHLAAPAQRDVTTAIQGHAALDEDGLGQGDGVRPAAIEVDCAATTCQLRNGIMQRLFGAASGRAVPDGFYRPRRRTRVEFARAIQIRIRARVASRSRRARAPDTAPCARTGRGS